MWRAMFRGGVAGCLAKSWVDESLRTTGACAAVFGTNS